MRLWSYCHSPLLFCRKVITIFLQLSFAWLFFFCMTFDNCSHPPWQNWKLPRSSWATQNTSTFTLHSLETSLKHLTPPSPPKIHGFGTVLWKALEADDSEVAGPEQSRKYHLKALESVTPAAWQVDSRGLSDIYLSKLSKKWAMSWWFWNCGAMGPLGNVAVPPQG